MAVESSLSNAAKSMTSFCDLAIIPWCHTHVRMVITRWVSWWLEPENVAEISESTYKTKWMYCSCDKSSFKFSSINNFFTAAPKLLPALVKVQQETRVKHGTFSLSCTGTQTKVFFVACISSSVLHLCPLMPTVAEPHHYSDIWSSCYTT